MNAKDSIKKIGLEQAYRYLDKDPENNVPKILDFIEKYDKSRVIGRHVDGIRRVFADKDGGGYRLINSLWTDIDSGQRKRLFETIVINSSVIGMPRERECREKYGCNIPWAILMDPTSACNLHCTGCWAAEYGDRLNLTYEQLDSIIRQGEELGVYMYVYAGGEPLVRKADILRLCRAHPECAFLAFTNATLIDDAFADEMLEVKNLVPAISVEGYESDTDFRRGEGTFRRVREAMERLRARKLMFGVSCCYTRRNADVIGSEAYYDSIVEWGAKFAWFFTYMPVGCSAPTDLMATAEQRKFMYQQVRAFRKTKPLFTIDFWNDAEYVGGCIAGGRSYLHINAGGDVEPCAFIHYSDTNIRDHTLLQALQAPLFMSYRDNQPFNGNMLRPCPALDNPEKLAAMVDRTGAPSTDMLSPEDVHAFTGKCEETAKKWAPVADELWAAGHYDFAEKTKDVG